VVGQVSARAVRQSHHLLGSEARRGIGKWHVGSVVVAVAPVSGFVGFAFGAVAAAAASGNPLGIGNGAEAGI